MNLSYTIFADRALTEVRDVANLEGIAADKALECIRHALGREPRDGDIVPNLGIRVDRISVPYFYRPLPGYNGKVLKCAGICTEDNVIWFTRENPGTLIVDRYLGDRIRADDLTEVKG